jgi:hypothetical protein
MSSRAVRSAIRDALSTTTPGERPHVRGAEMRSIVARAEADAIVSPSEARQIDALVTDGARGTQAEALAGQTTGAERPRYTVDRAAVREANAMFVRNQLPYGSNTERVRARIAAALETHDLGEPLATPPSTRGLHALQISDRRPVDGPLLEAFVRPGRAGRPSEVLVKQTNARQRPGFPGEYWYKPLKLDLETPDVKPGRLAALEAARQAAGDALHYGSPVDVLPTGVRFVRAELAREPAADGYVYTALVPVALLSSPKPADPNDIDQFFVERAGGLAGLREVAGPLTLGH